VNLALVCSDVVLALVIWELAVLVQILRAPPGYLSEVVVASIVPIALVWMGFRAIQGLYPGYGMDGAEELRRQTYALLATLAFTALFALAFQIGDALSRLLLGLVFVGLLLLSPLVRYLMKKWMMRHGVWGKPVAILGSEAVGTRVEELLSQEWGLGFRPAVLFDARPEGRLVEVKEGGEGRPGGNVLTEAVELGRKHRVDTLFLAMPHAPREYLAELADLASIHFRSVVVIPDLAGVTNSTVMARNLAGTLGLEVRHNLLAPWVRRFKRGLDVIGTLAGGLLISPLLLTLVALIKLGPPGPAFYGSLRRGSGGRQFRCWKFRTMHPDAERLLDGYLRSNPGLRSEWEQNYKLRVDPRITRIGRFLRKTSLDELPQLWNVLLGEMSLVGPRPILEAEMLNYGETYELYKRVTPGITGLWQVSGRNNISYEERVTMNAYYVRNWSIWLDLVILARTVSSVVLGRGAR
jgi:Undecaprenyl-phosphate galactose phosphotransferase WbaP